MRVSLTPSGLANYDFALLRRVNLVSLSHGNQVALQMSDITAVDGSTLPLRFAKVPKKGTKGETTADMVIASPFMFYYSPILVPMLAVALPVAALHKGKPKQIPMGERYEVYTAEQGKVIVR